jgi:hypothetical protein
MYAERGHDSAVEDYMEKTNDAVQRQLIQNDGVDIHILEKGSPSIDDPAQRQIIHELLLSVIMAIAENSCCETAINPPEPAIVAKDTHPMVSEVCTDNEADLTDDDDNCCNGICSNNADEEARNVSMQNDHIQGEKSPQRSSSAIAADTIITYVHPENEVPICDNIYDFHSDSDRDDHALKAIQAKEKKEFEETEERFRKRKAELELEAEKRARARVSVWRRDKKSLKETIDESLSEHAELHERAHALRLTFEEERKSLQDEMMQTMKDQLREELVTTDRCAKPSMDVRPREGGSTRKGPYDRIPDNRQRNPPFRGQNKPAGMPVGREQPSWGYGRQREMPSDIQWGYPGMGEVPSDPWIDPQTSTPWQLSTSGRSWDEQPSFKNMYSRERHASSQEDNPQTSTPWQHSASGRSWDEQPSFKNMYSRERHASSQEGPESASLASNEYQLALLYELDTEDGDLKNGETAESRSLLLPQAKGKGLRRPRFSSFATPVRANPKG